MLLARAPLECELDGFWSTLHSDGTVFGVHVRHGDYSVWRGGVFYRDWDWYRSKVRELIDQTGASKVIVASDQPAPDRLFQGLPVALAPDSIMLDLYALARCDMVFGPPSTFSVWAAFIGGHELAHFDANDVYKFSGITPELLGSTVVI